MASGSNSGAANPGSTGAPSPAPSASGPGTSPTGKYFHINVPNFNNSSGEAEAMGTYLRLGAVADPGLVASPNAPPWMGEDLAAEITSFIDDDRVRDGCPDFIPPAERQAETSLLHTKGGWRDHTDGNRVSTTRGDKVEVIKGNYRMVVLGRQHEAAGWDVSGGHVGESGITFDGASSIEYTTEDYGGTWVVVENTRKGHVHTAYHGKVFDYYCGEIVESITGSEAPTVGQPNPVVTERTWAESIASYTGSQARMVPMMTQETWAEIISDTTTANTISSATTVLAAMTSTTTAGTMSDATTVTDSITSTTTAATISSTTTATTITDSTTAALISSTTVGSIRDLIMGDSESTIIGSENETVIGDVREVTTGSETSMVMGMETSMTLGLKTDMFLGLAINLLLSGEIGINASFELTEAPVKIKNAVVKLDQVVTDFKNCGMIFMT
jgi:hypothetical protein